MSVRPPEEGGDITVRLIMSTTKPVRVSPTTTLADMRRCGVHTGQGITLHSCWCTVCVFGCPFMYHPHSMFGGGGGGGGGGLIPV